MHSKIVFTEKGLAFKKDLREQKEADLNFHEKYGDVLKAQPLSSAEKDPFKYRFSLKNTQINLNDSNYKIEPMYFYKNTIENIRKQKHSPHKSRVKLETLQFSDNRKMAETMNSFANLRSPEFGFKTDVLTMTQSANFMKPFLYKKEWPEVVERMELKRSLYLTDKVKTFDKLKSKVAEIEELKNIRCDLSYGKDLESSRKEFERLKGNFANERKRYLERIHNFEKKKYQPIFKRLKLSKAKIYEKIL